MRINVLNTLYFFTFFLIFTVSPSYTFAQNTVFNADKDLWGWKSDGYISLNWENYGDDVIYDVYRRSIETDTNEKINSEPLKLTNIIDTDKSLHGDYEYYIQFLNEDRKLIYEANPLVIKNIDHRNGIQRSLSQNSQTIEEQRQHITTDLEFRNFDVMTLENIQNFLENANSFLAEFETEDASGNERSAGEIIFKAANENGINPQAILTTLQKEQALISTMPGDATQYQLDWAMGYAVGNETWRGFGNQVDRAAWQFDKYYRDMQSTGTTVSGWGVLIPKETEDCLVITPVNMATAALYTYTPLSGAGWGGCTPFGGNFLYWDLFYNRYRFDAGPEGDFESENLNNSLGCSVSGFNASESYPINILLVLLPLIFALFRYKLKISNP